MVRVADEKGMGMNVGKENEINQNKKNGRKRKNRRMEVAVVLEGLFLENGECGFSGLWVELGREEKKWKMGKKKWGVPECVGVQSGVCCGEGKKMEKKWASDHLGNEGVRKTKN